MRKMYFESSTGDYVYKETPLTDAFLNELEAVCRKHQLSLVTDGYGCKLRVAKFSDENIEDIREAVPYDGVEAE